MAATLIFSPGPYHIISYGTLLGTQVFHSFINATAAFRTLERPAFAILQRALFPWYFGIQTIMPVALALTYPGSRIAASGIQGALLNEANRWDVAVPLATMFVTGLINWAYCLPVTNAITDKRRTQEKKDGKQSWDATPQSQEMQSLNKQFGKIHGISSLLNLVTLLATITYGFNLSARIQ
ncbi:hypothetical protein BKA67DRAFT_564819 [Truncatella angustata]|uniref:TMEM205-like domain-containing protein n=1 Tax=Truncatella angustata TaxID=152316 RepID=A0A9P8ZXU1_9PEZI|nr:uncharacterized protein BKA67DRAFT_564819 [Truncatella angustata]KAH6654349.1 hypothetical protein BKA67DRAFT_564819 [Truncatella angustata]KAH8198504.1 hypothetical protein TruAng_007338 [Truncatella angustata]